MAESESRQYVSHASIEELLFELETLPGESRVGLFGPDDRREKRGVEVREIDRLVDEHRDLNKIV
jgi:hypothetical protein